MFCTAVNENVAAAEMLGGPGIEPHKDYYYCMLGCYNGPAAASETAMKQ